MNKITEILDDTIQVLQEMKRSGVTHVEVAPSTMSALVQPPPIASARRKTQPRTTEPHATARPLVAFKGDWPALEAAAKACVKCRELARTRKNVVVDTGNRRAELMFIGEAPGHDEDLAGEPFVGRAGELLTKIIQAMGFRREEVYIANVLKCRPPENRQPLPDEAANCLPFLLAQVEMVHPKVIVGLGATAVKALLDVSLGITKMRGNWYDFHGIPLMPTFHPAYLLRNPPAKKEVWEDMKTVLAKLGREVPKPR